MERLQTQALDGPGTRIHLCVILMILCCLLLLLWAWQGKLDVFSTASGEVVPSGQIKKVQHLEGGIVQEILVREGDHVSRGQQMIILAKTASTAHVDELSIRLVGLQVDIARLTAVVEEQERPAFPVKITDAYPELVRQADTFFQSARMQYRNELKIRKNLLLQKQKDHKQIQVRLTNARNNLTYIDKQVKISEDLLEEDLTDQYTHLGLLREHTALKSQIDEDGVALERIKAEITEARSMLRGLSHQHKNTAMEELEKKRQEYNELSRRLMKYSDQLQRTVMSAPVDGIIKSLHVFAQGEVVKAGNTVAEIVPEGVSLVIDALLPPGDIGYVKPGQPVLVMLASADAARFEKLKGQVLQVSPDTFTAQDGYAYYKVQIQPEQDYFQGRNIRYELRAGVQVHANIIIGKRRVLDYFLDPFRGSFSSALSEL